MNPVPTAYPSNKAPRLSSKVKSVIKQMIRRSDLLTIGRKVKYSHSIPTSKRFWTASRLTIGFTCCALFCGCSGEDAELSSLTGTVTYRGKPISDGRISLLPISPTLGRPVSVPIVNGTYRFEGENRLNSGEHRVEIEGFRKTGKKTLNLTSPDRAQAGPESVDELVPYVPPRFNLQSTLRLQLEPGTNEKDFDLRS